VVEFTSQKVPGSRAVEVNGDFPPPIYLILTAAKVSEFYPASNRNEYQKQNRE
jgi:hypothetical protein